MPNEFCLKEYVRAYLDFPKKGINFYDITGLLKDAEAFAITISRMTKMVSEYSPDRIIAVDSKGFFLAAPIALNLGLGLSLVRKAGKLPGETTQLSYDLEYDSDSIEIRRADFNINERLVVIDDVLASGGTLAASVELLKKENANVVGAVAALEIGFLKGRDKIKCPVSALLFYEN